MSDYGYRNRLIGSAAQSSLSLLLLNIDRLDPDELDRLKKPIERNPYWAIHFMGRHVSISYDAQTESWSVEWPGMKTQALSDADLLNMLRHLAVPQMLTVVMGEISDAAAAGHDLRGLELEAVASDVIET